MRSCFSFTTAERSSNSGERSFSVVERSSSDAERKTDAVSLYNYIALSVYFQTVILVTL